MTADLAAGSGLADGHWRRLHPLSPLARAGGVAVGIVLVIGQTMSSPQRSGSPHMATIISIALAVLVLGGGVVSWAVTRWRINGGDLQLETGLIRRRSIRVPLTRIQAVDIFAPLTARILGLAEVRVISAGRGADRARLAYLRAADAPAVRANLLALAHGLEAGTPEPPAHLLAHVDNRWLAAGLLLRGHTLGGLALSAAAVGISVAQPRVAAAAGVGVFTAVVGLVVGAVRPFNDDYGFTISEAGDGLRLDRGLLQTRHETIPFGRIQAVRLDEPLLWRMFGWCRLEVDVARQHVREQADRDGNRVARTLLPVATRDQARWLLARVMPGAEMSPPAGSAPPPRARLRAPLSFHFLALWFDDRHLCARVGRVQASTVIVPLAKMQSVRLASGPVQRRLRLATVHVDTAGRRWHAAAHSRDQGEACGLLARIPDLSRDARSG